MALKIGMKWNLFFVLMIVFLMPALALTESRPIQVPQERDLSLPGEQRLNAIQPPKKIMDAIGLQPGMSIGDIGAGSGRFALWFSQRVGGAGRVYANDIDRAALNRLRERCRWNDLTNVEIVVGEVEKTNIPDHVLDIAFMINVYHHLEKPVELVRSIIPTLKPGGILIIVENDPAKSGDSSEESTFREKMRGKLAEAGFEITKVETFLQRDNIYFSRPKT